MVWNLHELNRTKSVRKGLPSSGHTLHDITGYLLPGSDHRQMAVSTNSWDRSTQCTSVHSVNNVHHDPLAGSLTLWDACLHNVGSPVISPPRGVKKQFHQQKCTNILILLRTKLVRKKHDIHSEQSRHRKARHISQLSTRCSTD